ncbi:hypothetical protein BQ8794_320105 [Mesorhizobium prunaredense]|uniref:Uncharacterized protein n=1 Tax=Mesorhizobium prunaredense TaxID=1631249 RepID=A0A1R3VBL6_9HYPH|nr:hypothetical protein BQ8794_320105 [Mesorhizobium prunaredense]
MARVVRTSTPFGRCQRTEGHSLRSSPLFIYDDFYTIIAFAKNFSVQKSL